MYELKCIVHTFKRKKQLWTDKYKTSMKNMLMLHIAPLNTRVCWKPKHTRVHDQHARSHGAFFTDVAQRNLYVGQFGTLLCIAVLQSDFSCQRRKKPPKAAPRRFSRHICSSLVRLSCQSWQLHWCAQSHPGSTTCQHIVPSSSWSDPVGRPPPGWRSARLQHSSRSMGFCSQRKIHKRGSQWASVRTDQKHWQNLSPTWRLCWRQRCVQQDILQMFTNICSSRRTDLAWHFPAQTLANNAATAFLTNTPGRGSCAGG